MSPVIAAAGTASASEVALVDVPAEDFSFAPCLPVSLRSLISSSRNSRGDGFHPPCRISGCTRAHPRAVNSTSPAMSEFPPARRVRWLAEARRTLAEKGGDALGEIGLGGASREGFR